MIKYVRRDASKLTDTEWDTFFSNFNAKIISTKLSGSDARLTTLKEHANEVSFPIVTAFDISGTAITTTPDYRTFSGNVETHNNGITEISVLNYLTNLHYLGNMFPMMLTGSEPSTRKKIHMTDIFLPWHRLYLVEFETLLGSPAHYWNWYDDQAIPTKMKVSNLKDVLKDGTTKIYKDLNRSSEDLTDGNLGSNRTDFRDTFKSRWKSLYDSARINSFVSIGDRIEGSLHNNMHSTISGDAMGNLLFSPYDPIFWFHHSFVDKIWADFYNTLSDDERNAIVDYPTAELPFFTKKADQIKDIKKDLMISFQGLFKDRGSI
ncbi:MAG: tyrosinase family protein [Bacteroidetes bacterium]|nr:tyrosinase family protein [Bacteroidota bacterium]